MRLRNSLSAADIRAEDAASRIGHPPGNALAGWIANAPGAARRRDQDSGAWGAVVLSVTTAAIARGRRIYGAAAYSGPRSHGPVIATVMPGVWMLTNSVRASGSQHAPQNSLSR